MNEPISVTMLTKNSERYLEEVLGALVSFDEVVVLDNGSSDRTLEIARRFPNVSLHTHPFIGFGPMKNLAAKYARNDWILSIDSDEIISEALVEEIAASTLDPDAIYTVLRENYYRGKPIRCCGWQNDRVKRLYHRTRTHFSEVMVHESLIEREGMRTIPLHAPLTHRPFEDASELIAKMQHYSTLFAQTHRHTKKSSPQKALLRALFAFFKSYALQRGFLFGYEGFVISASNAAGVFYKYIKLYEANQS